MNAAGASTVIETTGSSSKVVHIPYDEAYEEGFEDMERRVPDIAKIDRPHRVGSRGSASNGSCAT